MFPDRAPKQRSSLPFHQMSDVKLAFLGVIVECPGGFRPGTSITSILVQSIWIA
jgi:hypothetical protein